MRYALRRRARVTGGAVFDSPHLGPLGVLIWDHLGYSSGAAREYATLGFAQLSAVHHAAERSPLHPLHPLHLFTRTAACRSSIAAQRAVRPRVPQAVDTNTGLGVWETVETPSYSNNQVMEDQDRPRWGKQPRGYGRGDSDEEEKEEMLDLLKSK